MTFKNKKFEKYEICDELYKFFIMCNNFFFKNSNVVTYPK